MSSRSQRSRFKRSRFKLGDCVKIPDGRIGRVRGKQASKYKIRVRRTTSPTHQFLLFAASDLRKAPCPKGWMTPAGYVRYLKPTLAKMKERMRKKRD